VFLLSQLEGRNYAQIARQLGISERTVKRHMALAFEAIILFEGQL
jgi:DNA-directed RNA polymerase specialized sigma24 family protein